MQIFRIAMLLVVAVLSAALAYMLLGAVAVPFRGALAAAMGAGLGLYAYWRAGRQN